MKKPQPDPKVIHIDPVSGRPLHEFLANPLAVPPSETPTEGKPITEPPGTQVAHPTNRTTPKLMITIKRDVDPAFAAKEAVELIRLHLDS